MPIWGVGATSPPMPSSSPFIRPKAVGYAISSLSITPLFESLEYFITMPSLVIIIIQSAVLKAAANLTAQALSRWGAEAAPGIDWARAFEFAIFGLVSAPLVSIWQRALEETFPTQNGSGSPHAPSAQGTKHQRQINWFHVILKLLIDQTIGLCFTNIIFITCTTGASLQSTSLLLHEIQTRIFGILKAGWRIWPVVSLANFLWVPWQWRVVVTSVVGFGWNIILSFLSN